MSEETQWLTRGATSLTLMLKGYDSEMDAHLEKLRNTLKKSKFDLEVFKKALKGVETVYDELEDLRSESISNYKRTFEILLDEEQAGKILAPLQSEQPLILDLLRVAEPLANYINITVNRDEPSKLSQERVAELKNRLIHRFRILLQTLSLLDGESRQLQDIERRLSEAPDWNELDCLAKETTDLLKEHLTEEKKQFEDYLAELNEKLTRINLIVKADSVTLLELKEINQVFNFSINTQMAETRAKLEANHQLDSMKSELLNSLDNIAKRLESYQSTYSEKLYSLQSNKEAMKIHTKQLEQDNLTLLAELNKERKLSMQDMLTQLPNRQGFNKRLEEELSRAERYQQPISIAIFDIDFFKRINDEFGHLVGDKVLRMVAKEMNNKCRESDFLARFGGEEFVLLLPQSSLEDAVSTVDKIRIHIETRPFHFQNKPVPLTVSGGVAQHQPNENIESWLDRADTALYESKRNGRNKVSASANLNTP